MSVYLYESIARNSGQVGWVRMSKERIATYFPRALGLAVGEKMYLNEEESGYTDCQNFINSIRSSHDYT
jgi:hypothetical protein